MPPFFLTDNNQDSPRGGAGGEPQQDPSGDFIGNSGIKLVFDKAMPLG
jgi:hypothetical protein